MNKLIERCITEIRNKSEKNGIEGYDAQAPKNPSIIVNFNLDDETLNNYYGFLEQIWPSVYSNIKSPFSFPLIFIILNILPLLISL